MVNRQAKRLVGQKSFRLKVFVNIQTHAHIELTALYAPSPFHRSIFFFFRTDSTDRLPGLFTNRPTSEHIIFVIFIIFIFQIF